MPYNERGEIIREDRRPNGQPNNNQSRQNYRPTYTPSNPTTTNRADKTIRKIIFGIIGFIALYFIGSSFFSGSDNNRKSIPTRTNYTNNNIINRTGYISANQYANIRDGNSTSSDVINTKNRGESVYVLERDQYTGWYKVRYGNNNYGYISNDLISFNPVSTNSTRKTTVKSNAIIVSNKSSIISQTKLRTYPNTFRGIVGILNYGVQVDNDLNNLFRKEFNVPVNDKTLKRFGFQQLSKSAKFKCKYVNRPLTQKEIYEHLDIQKSITYLKATATPDQLRIYNNGNSQNTRAPQNTRDNNGLSNSLLGNWQIIDENSSYSFNSNGRGYYVNSRNRRFEFNWSTTSNNLIITLDYDRSIWNWRIQSISGNLIKMYSYQHNQNRTIRKK